MAKDGLREKKPHRHGWLLPLINKSDEEIGRELRRKIEGRMVTATTPVAKLLLRFSQLSGLRLSFIDDAIASDEPLGWLAASLACEGEYERAGRAFRLGASPKVERLLQRQIADSNGRLKKITKRLNFEACWLKEGERIRKSEKGVAMSNVKLANRLKTQCGGKPHTIRQALPRLGLDAKQWRQRRRVKS